MHPHRKRATATTAVDRAMNTLLERPMWPQSLSAGQRHARRHDDTDGQDGPEHGPVVYLARDSDAWVVIGGHTLRFREPFGGGLSPHTRNALLVPAEAIRRDNEEFPQHDRPAEVLSPAD